MNVLLLGGTGPMGIHLTKILSSRGDHVYITSRSYHENLPNVIYFKGNAREPRFVDKILKKYYWDCIVDFMVYGTDEFKNRIDILMQSTRQYIFLSSSRVYADCDSLITETSPRLLDVTSDVAYLKTDEYALYKAREEDIIMGSKYDNYTILRPYITYAENRLPLGVYEKETWVRRFLEKKDIALPQKFLAKETTLTYGMDVSLYIGNIVGNLDAIGKIFNIVSDKSCKWSDVLEYYLEKFHEITGFRPRVFVVNSFITDWRQMVINLCKDLCLRRSSINIANNNYQLIYDREFNRIFDNKKTKELVPDYVFGKYEDHLGKCLESFISSPEYSYSKKWSWEAVQDKITNSTTPVRLIPSFKSKIIYILIRYIIPSKYIVKR